MTDSAPSLTFKTVDDLAVASGRGALNGRTISARRALFLGPWLELRRLQSTHASMAAVGSDWVDGGDFAALWTQLDTDQKIWTRRYQRRLGFIRTRHAADNQGDWTQFTLEAKRAGVASGLTGDLAGQVVSALDELMDNVMEHSRAPRTGVAAFAEGGGVFEIIIADEGIGVLESLKTSTEFNDLADNGEALKLFIKEGVSRFGTDSGRGMGFRPLFTGLANAQCSLRFRSGDYALEIDGTELSRAPANLIQTTHLNGLICSIRCHHRARQ